MADREKIISDLEWIHNALMDFQAIDPEDFVLRAIPDAIALLKEQEPKQVEAEAINEIDRLYRCPSCHISMMLRKQPYCHSCGQAVKWE